ncbi:MAG TPA: hypothetical protein VFI22_19505 [Thermomicrobiales bacterium]|nr:hypothetical protein [Thermomicrobiales bacterium]
MNSVRFDALARRLSAAGTRRHVLRAALVAAVTPLAAAAQPEPARCLANGKRCRQPEAETERHGHRKRKKHGKHHPPSCAKCCSRFGAAGANGKSRCSCKPEGVACDHDAQCCGAQCRAGACTACPPDQVFCPDGCANLQTDKQHCGTCATACANGQRCQDGTCVCDAQSCPTGCCGGTDGTACQRGTRDDACGIGGAVCVDCAADGVHCESDGHCCMPDSVATTCGDICGTTVTNNCGQDVVCPCTVFISSVRYDGNFSGLTGADAQCQGLADGAGRQGTYLAWLSDDDGSPATRFAQAATPYALVDGAVVANDWDDLTSGSLRQAINVFETGGFLFSSAFAWTNTTTDGQLASANDGDSCFNWTGNDAAYAGGNGDATATDAAWTEASGGNNCGFPIHLYCFQQPAG